MNGLRICLRSPKLNQHPGLYLRVFGKWYRVWEWGDWATALQVVGLLLIVVGCAVVLAA